MPWLPSSTTRGCSPTDLTPATLIAILHACHWGTGMATIITVHGTGATGPEEGEAWWQKGSAFERDMRQLIEAEAGELNFQPHIWDGANSETSRRAAARRLYEAAQQLETKKEKYSII